MDDDKAFRNTSSVKIEIPRYERVTDGTGKEYTVYKVVIAKPGGTKEVEKRYREFDKLHRSLNKSAQLPRNIEFPPKRFSPSSATKEERRGKLKKFLQELCDLNPIPDEVLHFLGISQPIQSNFMNSRTNDNLYSSCEDLLDGASYTHQPLIGYTKDPFTFDHLHNSKDDILLKGILDGIFGDSDSKGCYFIDIG